MIQADARSNIGLSVRLRRAALAAIALGLSLGAAEGVVRLFSLTPATSSSPAAFSRATMTLGVLAANLSRRDRDALRRFCAGRGIGLLEIAPALAASMTGEQSGLIFGRYDRHWNARANALIAGQLAPYIEERRTR